MVDAISEEFAKWVEGVFAGTASTEESERRIAPSVLETHGAAKVIELMLSMAEGRAFRSLVPGPIASIPLLTLGDGEARLKIECHLDANGRLSPYVAPGERLFDDRGSATETASRAVASARNVGACSPRPQA